MNNPPCPVRLDGLGLCSAAVLQIYKGAHTIHTTPYTGTGRTKGNDFVVCTDGV